MNCVEDTVAASASVTGTGACSSRAHACEPLLMRGRRNSGPFHDGKECNLASAHHFDGNTQIGIIQHYKKEITGVILG